MIVTETTLQGAVVLEPETLIDQRGKHTKMYCANTLKEYGIDFVLKQANIVFNQHSLTLRGMHFQRPPFCEQKIVTCYKGSIYDVIIDLNKDSETFGKWYGIELTEENGRSLYIPKGFAHGYVTLQSHTVIHHMVSENYTPSHECGVRWNDPAFQIDWPQKNGLIVSKKDQRWDDFDSEYDYMQCESSRMKNVR